VVAAVLVLAAAAAGDALRRVGAVESAVAPRAQEIERDGPAEPGFVLAGEGAYEGDGRLLHTRVLRSGREYLSAEAVARAFPGADKGLIDILRVAAGPNGMLVLGVIRFPPGRAAQSGVELWRGNRLVDAFLVEPGSFGGGLAFDRTGELMALFSPDGALRGVYDLSGRRFADFPDRFLAVG
jgi:hypothetical protein